MAGKNRLSSFVRICVSSNMARPYRKTRRAETAETTRNRIVAAAIALHEARGVAATSMRDVAAEAGVGLASVYRHFPDGETLVAACSGSYFRQNPPPDPAAWLTIKEPRERLRRALESVFAYHRLTAPMMGRVLHELKGSPVVEPYEALWEAVADDLAMGWPGGPQAERLVRAGIRLALSFETWSRLTDAGLSDAEAVEVASRLAGA